MQGTAFLKQNAVNLAESGERIMNKWNRDWSTFDWRTVQEGLNDNDSELGLTKAEYLQLNQHGPSTIYYNKQGSFCPQ